MKKGVLIFSQGKTGTQSIHSLVFSNMPLDWHILNSHDPSIMVDNSGIRKMGESNNIECPQYEVFPNLGIHESRKLIDSYDVLKVITVFRNPFDVAISDFLESIKIEAALLHMCGYYGDIDYAYSDDLLNKKSLRELICVPRFKSWIQSEISEPHSCPKNLRALLNKFSDRGNNVSKELVLNWMVESFIEYERINEIFIDCSAETALESLITRYKEITNLADHDFDMTDLPYKMVNKEGVKYMFIKFNELVNNTASLCDFLSLPHLSLPKSNITSNSNYHKWYGVSDVDIKNRLINDVKPSTRFKEKSILKKLGI